MKNAATEIPSEPDVGSDQRVEREPPPSWRNATEADRQRVPSPARATLTVPEAAQLLGLSESAAYEAAARGDIPAVRIGRRVLVIHDQLLALLRNSASASGQR